MENGVIINKKSSGKYYINILVECENKILPIISKNFLGLDFAMYGLYAASDEDDAFGIRANESWQRSSGSCLNGIKNLQCCRTGGFCLRVT